MRLTTLARTVVTGLQARLQEVDERIAGYERQIAQLAQQNEAAKRLMAVDGVVRSPRLPWWP